MKYPVEFISLEEDEKDILVSFAIPDGKVGIKSLILHRTFYFEEYLEDEERGVKVSLEGDSYEEEPFNTLELIEISDKEIKIDAKYHSYVVDVSKIDNSEISQLKRLVKKQNYDQRFTIKNTEQDI